MDQKIIILLALFFHISVFTQEYNEESKTDNLDYLLKMSNNSMIQNEMVEALEYAYKAATYSHQLESNYYLSYSYLTIGNIQYKILDYENSKRNMFKALDYAELSESQEMLPYILQSLGNLYYESDRDYENALMYYKRGLAYARDKVPEKNLLIPLYNIAWTYMDLNRYEEAYPYLIEAEKISQATPDDEKTDFSSNYLLNARKNVHDGNIKKAKEYFDKTYKALITYEKNWIKGMSYFYEYRSQMYEKIGDHENALADQKKFYKNELKVFENARLKSEEISVIRSKLDRYEQELEASIREKELLQNIQRNNITIIYISLLVLLLLIIAVFFYYRSYKSKKLSNEILESKNLQLLEAKTKEEKLSKVKSQFISTITHELRTPLYGIIGISAILSDNKRRSEKDRKLLSSLKFSADYLLDLVNKVLKISKLDSEKSEKTVLTPTPTNLFSLCENIIESFEYQAKQKGNKFSLNFDATIPHQLEIDTLRLSEILINLIGNGNKFTDQGNISLEVEMKQQTENDALVYFEVSDTGIGIPEDQKDIIFEEFTQIGSVYDNKQGTGLGLSIVKNLIHIMGSEIHFDSEKGKGSKFYFTLKFSISNSLSKFASSDCLNALTETLPSARILVAEDNKINQLVTQNLLANINCKSTIVENGIEAVNLVKEQDFDLILMDINMPIMDGMKATQKIRTFNKSIPIIALTAAEIEEVEKACKEVGVTDLLNKPLTKLDLKDAIHRNLRRNQEKADV